MPLTKWRPFGMIERLEPFGEVDALRREMNNLLEQFTSNFPHTENGLSFMPSAEMEETDSEIRLKLEVPGMQADDIDIEVMDEAVSIKGERKSTTKEESDGNVRSEFHYGQFERVVAMPTAIVKDSVVASYKDGVLSLTIPKAQEDTDKKSVKVPVSS